MLRLKGIILASKRRGLIILGLHYEALRFDFGAQGLQVRDVLVAKQKQKASTAASTLTSRTESRRRLTGMLHGTWWTIKGPKSMFRMDSSLSHCPEDCIGARDKGRGTEGANKVFLNIQDGTNQACKDKRRTS